MKSYILFFLLLICISDTKAQAQNAAEWLQQKKTQKKYLIQQIAALQMQIGYVKKGYSISKEGLNTISNLKDGDFNLHSDFFNSLRTVNPQVKKYAKIADIVSLQIQIVKTYKNTLKFSDGLTAGEIRFAGKKFERMLDHSAAILDELLSVTSDGRLEMKDEERIQSIDRLHDAMLENATYAQQFSNEVKSLQAARAKEKIDIQTFRGLHGIKK